ncbi:hypothetical protein GGG16DRAFT_90531 [Schizophyllum commune]
MVRNHHLEYRYPENINPSSTPEASFPPSTTTATQSVHNDRSTPPQALQPLPPDMSPPLPSFLAGSKRTESTFEQIPVIDFQDMISEDKAKRQQLAEKIRDACVNVGFFYLANPPASLFPPGLPESTIEKHAKPFFALPKETKTGWDIHKSANFKGYTAMHAEKTDTEAEGRGDWHEGFDVGWEEEGEAKGGEKDANGSAMAGANVWPPEEMLPGFRKGVMEYYHATVKLGLALFPLFALALDMPENFFEDKTTKPAAILRLLHYPNQPPVSKKNGEMGIGRHTDYECFTLLWQQTGITCLQVQNTAGRWVDAVPIEGSLVVNIGDQLARWTNDVFKSTPHRALNTSGKERYSMPLFFGVDYDVPLEAIPTCVSEEMPAKYPVMKAGDYVKQRLEETYAHSKA